MPDSFQADGIKGKLHNLREGTREMNQEISLTDVNAEFEEKVYLIAGEVLNILKELSSENKKQISSKMIAEKMSWKDSLKNILTVKQDVLHENNIDAVRFRELSNAIMDKFTEIVPSTLTDQLSHLKERLHSQVITEGSTEWLDSPMEIVKKYIHSLSSRNKELEEFMQQTMQYLEHTETHISSELSSQQEKFRHDRNFEEKISTNMNLIKQDCSDYRDVKSIKMAVFNKIENINKSIEQKRKQDMLRLKETEQTIEEMSRRMNEIKHDAEEIRMRSEEIEFESVRDNLTGIYNRKAYDQKIIEIIADFNRYNVPTSLMVCDIDYFKNINDNFGHRVGDLALIKLADLLSERLRVNDFISRYGGEEFAIILPHTNLHNAKKAGEGIRSYIDNAVFSYKEKEISLTISIGISSLRKGDDCNTVFERADRALYLAKRSGRNRVKSEDDVPAEGWVVNQE